LASKLSISIIILARRSLKLGIIPDFLLKRLYQKGSLRQTAEGIAFDLKNLLGPGMISGVHSVVLNNNLYTPETIHVITSGTSLAADKITPDNPISFRLHQEGTLILKGAESLKEGINQIIVSLIVPQAGTIQVILTDTI
jgi:hypothetical protein